MISTRDEARDFIRNNPQQYLKRDNQGKGYVCPCCGSGTGKKGTGITTKDGIHFTCWVGCFKNADIIDVIGQERGLTEYPEKLKAACGEYGIDFESLESGKDFKDKAYPLEWDAVIGDAGDTGSSEPEPKKPEPKKEVEDYTDFCKECITHLDECDYLDNRCISKETQRYYDTGFCEEWQNPKLLKEGKNPPPMPVIVFPVSKSSYVVRSIDPLEKTWRYINVGESSIYNLKAFKEAAVKEPVFVVEGIPDVYSIHEKGYKAIGLVGTGNYRKFLEYLEKNRPTQPILIALDNDKAGQETADKLLDGMKALNIKSAKVDITGLYKDANEHLCKDSGSFEKALSQAVTQGRTLDEYYAKNNAACLLKNFINDIRKTKNPYTPTGFSCLDNVVDGGFYQGLYTIGGISSLGKTTLALQIADNMAKGGRDVLIFSLEMSRSELIAKSISRNTAELAIEQKKPFEMSKTTRDITVGENYDDYTSEEIELIYAAADRYGKFADHIYMKEGMGDIDVHQIRAAVDTHVKTTGNTPVVVVDYLQIIDEYAKGLTDKQNIDKTVRDLRRIGRDFHTTVIVLSSLNRTGYDQPVTMQSFKESGSIEYSSDVLIGLQLEGVGSVGFDVDRAKSLNPRRIEVVVLKNREGKTGATIPFQYHTTYNLFVENSTTTTTTPDRNRTKTKVSKREQEQDTLECAFSCTANHSGGIERSTVRRMAEYMDKRTTIVRSLIKEYGGFKIEKGTGIVTRTSYVIDPLEKNPFEDK